MAFVGELDAVRKRMGGQIKQLSQLMKKHQVGRVTTLVSTFRSNAQFNSEWRAIWTEIVRSEGGKLSLTTVGAIIGASLGGVGIAAMGSAIGLPLAVILGLGGFIVGTEVDAVRQPTTGAPTISVSHELHARVTVLAQRLDMSPEEFASTLLGTAVAEWEDRYGGH